MEEEEAAVAVGVRVSAPARKELSNSLDIEALPGINFLLYVASQLARST